ncbi:MAG TPA: DUF6098 family protein [Acidimicrobiales bacterium]|nr:DUF6098 family protein [Acidimicrobiales bacterium]
MAEMQADPIPELKSLDELVDLAQQKQDLYVRWSHGPEVDLHEATSRDELTGAALPGLCANPLAVEPWWGDRPLRMWVARRLYDYRHLRDEHPGVRPWVLQGVELGRGPDNEPVVDDVTPVAWLSDEVVAEAVAAVEDATEDWGSLRRS